MKVTITIETDTATHTVEHSSSTRKIFEAEAHLAGDLLARAVADIRASAGIGGRP